MGKKRRAPMTVVPSDDFVVKDGGEEYYPHAGESVTFRKRVSPRDLMVIARAGDLQNDTEGEKGAAKLARFFHDEACVVLGRAIHSWTWTDPYSDEGTAYPEPSAEALRDLDAQTELQYLLEKWLGVSNPPEEVQEGNQP